MSYFSYIYNPANLRIVQSAVEEAKNKHFHNINYIIEMETSLYPKRNFTFGVLDKVEWFSDIALTQKVIQVDIAYNHDPETGMAIDRQTTRTYYYDDGTAHPDTKITTKDYTINPAEQLAEMKRRRGNNVDEININLIGLVPALSALDPQPVSDAMTQNDVIASGQAFFAQHESEKNVYIDTGSTALENIIRNIDTSQAPDNQFDWFDCDATSLGITGVVNVRGYIIWNLSAGVRTS